MSPFLSFAAFLCLWAGLAHGQTVLTVAAFPAVDDIVKAALPQWQKAHPGVEVRVVSRDFSDHHTAMITALSASKGLPDVMAIEYSFLGRFANSGAFEDLSASPYNAQKWADDFVAYAWAQGQSRTRAQAAIPTDIGPGAMFYRTDLLQQAGVDPSQLSASWDQLVQAGVQIKAKTGAHLLAHARDIKDIVIRSGLQPGEGIYFDAQGQSVVGSAPRFKRAFELARLVRQLQLDARVNAWSNEWGEALRRNHVAVQMMGAWLGGHLQNWLAPKTSGLWRSGPLPEKLALSWGGTFYALPKQSGHKDLAWDLVRYLTTDAAQQRLAFERFNAFPALLAAQQGGAFDEPVEFLGGQRARADWRATARQITATRVFKNDAIAQEIVDAELDLVLARGKSVDAALADAHRLVQKRAQR
jgi:multiple sugar transport system substrate-binding protein